MAPHSQSRRLTGEILLGIAVVVGLLLVRQYYGYTLFHVLAELFAVVVAAGVFIVTWNTRRMLDNGYLLVLGIALLFVGAVDLIHTLAYKGMGTLISQDETDVPTQLWLIARYLQAFAMLTATAFLTRRVRPWTVVAVVATLTSFAVASVLWWDLFPTALTPAGLTPFKIASEYVISGVLALAGLLLWRNRERFERQVLYLLLASVGATIASEMAFTLYVDPYGLLNLVGHILKVFAIYFIYKALVVTALQRPFSVLFREISEREAALTESEERYRTTFEQAAVGVAHIGLDGRWLRVNERLTQITGFERDELLGRHFTDVTHPVDAEKDAQNFQRLVAGEIGEYSLQKRTVRKDGVHRWIFVRRALVRDEHEAPSYVVSVTEDIEDRKRAEDKLRRAKELSEALTRADAAINSTLDFDAIVHHALVSGAEGIGCETASVTLREGKLWIPRDTHSFPVDIIDKPFTDEELPHAVLAAATREPVAISNAYDDDRVNPEVMRRYEIRSVLVVPLVSRGECIGSLYFNFHSHTHWFTPEEMAFATSLASAFALAVENSRLYKGQHKIADALQSALLTMPDSLPGVEIASAYRSSDDLARIGGDFYDAFDLGEGLIAFTLGDVSGKGLDAATITALARSTLRAFAYTSPRDPARVLNEANAVLARQLDEDRFVTALCGLLDTRSGRLTMATAGHPVPLLCGSEPILYPDMPANPPLGLFGETRYEQISMCVDARTSVVAFSDGVLDARIGDEMFGEDRLREAVDAVSQSSPADIVAAVIDAVEEFTEGRRTDDIAVAAFRLTSPRGCTES